MVRTCVILSAYRPYRIGYMLILISVCTDLLSQLPANTDSLRAELTKEIPDTTRVNTLNALSNSLIKSKDFVGTLAFATEALQIAEKVHYPRGIAYANMYLGVVDLEHKKYSEALAKMDLSYSLFKELKDSLGIARYFHRSGNIFFGQKLRREGIQRYKSAIQLYEKLEMRYPAESQFYLLNEILRIGDAALYIPDYELAKDYSQQGYVLAVRLGQIKEQAEAMRRLGAIDFLQHNYSAAAPNLNKSLQLSEAMEPLNDFDKHQTAVIHLYLGISYSRYLGNYAQGLQHYETAIKLQKELGNYKAECEAMENMGQDMVAHGEYTYALEQFLSLLTLSEKINDLYFMLVAHQNLGALFYRNRNYDEAEKHLAVAQSLNEKLRNKEKAGFILHTQGLIQSAKGNRGAAIGIFTDMKSLGEEMKDTHFLVIAYTNLLLLDVSFENHADILPLFLADLQKEEKKGPSDLTMDMYRFVGIFYYKMQDYVRAEEYFIKSLELAKILPSQRGIALAYRNLTSVKSIKGELEKALEYSNLYATHYDSFRNENNTRLVAEINTKYDTENKEKEIKSLQSEKVIRELELTIHQEELHRIELEKQKIQTENLFNRSQVDLLANEKRLQQLEIKKNEIELAMQRAETDSRQDQLVLLNKEGEIQKLEIKKQTLLKNYMMGGILLFTLLSFFIYNNYITRQKLKLQVLRNKIASDLHDDVGSTLSSIAIFSDIARQQSKEVIPMLDTIGESSRNMLDAMADIVWTIHPDNDQFEKIILRMRNFAYQLLGAKKIDFVFTVDEGMDQLKLPMEVRKNLYLIFKEATNNMVKYAQADNAQITIKEDHKSLVMTVRDNGKGFDVHQETEGNGLKNMRKRAEEIGGQLWIESRKNEGTMIKLKVAV